MNKLVLPVLVSLPALCAPADPAAQVLDAARAKAQAVAKARRAHVEAGLNTKDFRPDCSRELADVERRLEGEKRPPVRQALLVSRLYYLVLSRAQPTPAQLKATLQEVPATAMAWTLDQGLLSSLGEWAPAETEAYLAQARAQHPDGAIRRNLLFEHFWEALDARNEAAWKPSLESLRKDFPGSPETLKALEILESERKTAVGTPAPAFSIPALGDPSTVYSLDTFKGRYVLLDFWATWCPPCRAEMPHLHKAWARFKDRSFEILSLSFDRKVEHIAPFRRAAATPMPWKHAFVEGGFRNPIGEAYGVKGIPKPLLVGPDGKIVAAGGDLRGENLEKTLERFLGR